MTLTKVLIALLVIFGVIGAVQYFIYDAETSKHELALMSAREQQIAWQQKYDWCMATFDTINGQGHIDTLEVPDNHPVIPDSSQNENNHSQTENTQKWVSTVEIDTSKAFGDTCNPMDVRVWTKVWSTGEYKMVIQPSWNPLTKETKERWETGVFLGGGSVARSLTGTIGLDVSRGRTGLWIIGTLSEETKVGFLTGLRINF